MPSSATGAARAARTACSLSTPSLSTPALAPLPPEVGTGLAWFRGVGVGKALLVVSQPPLAASTCLPAYHR